MFGYVVANQAMLAKEETAVYASFYCGLCHELGKQYGWIGRMTLNYDLTFLLLLLTALYEPQEFQKTIRCAAHPFKRKTIRTNEITTYIAQMNMILSYEKCADDWMDDRSITAYLRKNMIGAKIAVDKSDTHDTGSAAHAAGRKNEDSASREPSETNENFMLREHERINKKTEHIRSCLLEIHQIERERKPDLDAASGVFGQLLAEIVCYRQDVWREALSGLGFHLGKFIYLVDAYEDLESDIQKDNYNPWIHRLSTGSMAHHTDHNRSEIIEIPTCHAKSNVKEAVYPYRTEQFEQACKSILTQLMSACCQAFEFLPITEHVNVLRNILYSGVWTRYERKREQIYRKQNHANHTPHAHGSKKEQS